jgi:hypothetical protein
MTKRLALRASRFLNMAVVLRNFLEHVVVWRILEELFNCVTSQ